MGCVYIHGIDGNTVLHTVDRSPWHPFARHRAQEPGVGPGRSGTSGRRQTLLQILTNLERSGSWTWSRTRKWGFVLSLFECVSIFLSFLFDREYTRMRNGSYRMTWPFSVLNPYSGMGMGSTLVGTTVNY